MILLDKVPQNKQAFANKVQRIANALGINADWLMLIMYHESRFNHRAINSIGCVGLIQFCPIGALQTFGLTASQMANLSNIEQLDYVYKFFATYKGKFQSFRDLYLYSFYPVALAYKNNPNYVFGSEGNFNPALLAQQNPLFDLNKDGKITMAEFTAYCNAFAKKYNASTSQTGNNNITFFLFLGFAYYLYKNDYI